MGYTHYFTQTRSFTQPEWNAITQDMRKVLRHPQLDGVVFGPMGTGKPQVASYCIRFNGNKETGEDHESMDLPRRIGKPDPNRPPGYQHFQFCKTARNLYDVAVVACLILCHYHALGVLEISSDGTQEDWQAGALIVGQTCGSYPIPATVNKADSLDPQDYLSVLRKYAQPPQTVEQHASDKVEAHQASVNETQGVLQL